MARRFLQTDSPWNTLLAVVVLVAITLLLVHPASRPGTRLAEASYDLGFLWRGQPPFPATPSEVVIVYVDSRTFEVRQQDPRQPLDRRLHARLVRRLHRAGARLVVFDILFDRPSDPPGADEDFAAAMRDQGATFLGAEWHLADTDQVGGTRVAFRGITLPTPTLLAAAAGYGFVFARMDPDLVVRRYFPGFLDRDLPSLTWAAARHLGLPSTDPASGDPTARWLDYYGPPLTLPGVSFTDALDPAAVPDEFFRNKVVFVGTRPSAGKFDERRDEWRSPLAVRGRGVPFMPAVEVHATQMLNLLRGDWLRRLPRGPETAVALASALLLAVGLGRLRPLPAAATALAAGLAVLGIAAALIGYRRLWFPWLWIGLVQIPAAAGWSFLAHSVQWYQERRRQLARIQRQAALIEKAQDAILVQDLAGQVIYANPRARALYGWTDPLPGPRVAERQLAADQPEVWQEARRIAHTRGDWSGELRQRDARDQLIVVECRLTLIRDDHGQPRELLFLVTDITEKQRLQEQFLRAQRMEGIGSLAGGMAHDLNNALAPVLMGIQLLRKRTRDDETLRMLRVMESHTHRGAGMVRQVLRFARGRDAGFSVIPLTPLIQELVSMVRETFPRNIATDLLVPDDLWPVRANPTQLHQLLLNLALNARDAMPDGGRLTVAADNAELDAEEAASLADAKPGRHVLLMVSDTGVGMPPDVQARVFEPFFTTKPAGRGTGLGLAGVATIVRSHGGALRLRSHPGQGTCFEIFLPAAHAEPTEAHEFPAPRRGQGECLLVIDEEVASRDLIRQGLEAHGYRVSVAGSGLEGLTQLRRSSEPFRLVIVGRHAPAENRDETLLDLRRLQPRLPILVLQGEPADDPVPPRLPPGPAASLRAPFDLPALLSRIVELLDPPA